MGPAPAALLKVPPIPPLQLEAPSLKSYPFSVPTLSLALFAMLWERAARADVGGSYSGVFQLPWERQ